MLTVLPSAIEERPDGKSHPSNQGSFRLSCTSLQSAHIYLVVLPTRAARKGVNTHSRRSPNGKHRRKAAEPTTYRRSTSPSIWGDHRPYADCFSKSQSSLSTMSAKKQNFQACFLWGMYNLRVLGSIPQSIDIPRNHIDIPASKVYIPDIPA